MSEDPRVTMEGRGGYRSGVPFLLQPFQLSPGTLVTIYEHDLPTLQLPHSAPGANLSSTPQLHQTNPQYPPVPPWPPDLRHIPHLDKTNLMSRMQNYICIMYVLIRGTHTGSHTRSDPLCSHWGVSGYSSAQAQRWVIKKSNTVNAQGHQHINI